MALTRIQSEQSRWMTPRWPGALPPAETLQAVYGADADELTLRFLNTPNRDIVVLWLATPKIEYAGLMVDEHSGDVVGVLIDYLAGDTHLRHPAWRAAAEPDLPPETAASIVKDVQALYDRYGLLSDTSP